MVAVSPHAHAQAMHLDTAAAAGLLGSARCSRPPTSQASTRSARWPMTSSCSPPERSTGVGEPVALVIADSADAAWRAAQLVTTDWVVRPAVLDAREAYVRGDLPAPPRTFASGDVDAAWADCATVVRAGSTSARRSTPTWRRTAPWPSCATTAACSCTRRHQSPSATQRAVAAVTGLPMNLVEAQVARLGGGFGGKEEQATPWAALAGAGRSRDRTTCPRRAGPT